MTAAAFCHDCQHTHGGRAYGLCLEPGCDCVSPQRSSSSTSAWDRLSRQASAAVALCDGLLAEVAGMLSDAQELRRLLPVRGWPPQFATREEWARWCDEDRRSETAEMFESLWNFGRAA